jgi:hypothetical protein
MLSFAALFVQPGMLGFKMARLDLLGYAGACCGMLNGLWYAVESYGMLWYAMAFCGMLWYTTVSGGMLYYSGI